MKRVTAGQNWIDLIRSNRDVFVALLVLVTVNVALAMMFRSYSAEREYLQKFRDISRRLDQLRARKAPQDERSRFAEESDEALRPILADLGKTANMSNPIRQHLLWAGRDHLLEMLRNSSAKSDRRLIEHQQQFRQHLQCVDEALMGK